MRRKPYQGINFVIAHDGFTLYDLVAYNSKHNDANGEQNRDGSNDNFSWNCGEEGETSNGGVNALRQRQMRNLMLALMVSQGTPMVLMGELLHSQILASCMHSANTNPCKDSMALTCPSSATAQSTCVDVQVRSCTSYDASTAQ